MAGSGGNEWKDYPVYTESQIESVLQHLGIDIVGQTETHFRVLCPFHTNTDGSAASVSKDVGYFHCFNPGCGVSKNLRMLVEELQGIGYYKAEAWINKFYVVEPIRLPEEKPDFVPFSQDLLDRMREDLWSPQGHRAREYLKSRGFTKQTIEYFDVGVSLANDMTIVPMYDPDGMPVGLIGRSIGEKKFKNSKNLPKSKTAWNFHRAKKYSSVIIVESSFDAMRLHQAGFPNVIALLGGSLSKHHIQQIDRAFETVTIMTDFDQIQYYDNCRKCDGDRCFGHRPGRELGHAIATNLNKRILWATYDHTCVYPHGAKDVGDMTDAEINQCIRYAVSNFEYQAWGIDSYHHV